MKRSYLVALAIVCVAVLAGIGFETTASRYTRLGELASSAIAFIEITATSRGKLRDGSLIASSLAVGLFLVEGGQLAFGKADPVSKTPGLTSDSPLMGWAPGHPGTFHATKIDGNGRVVYDTHVTIDENLIRKTVGAKGPGRNRFLR